MNDSGFQYVTTSIEPTDAKAGFVCGERALDDYFARHAVSNDQAGISRAYILRRGPLDDPDLPTILGFYTLSMANAESSQVAKVIDRSLPKYPMPVALVGRFAVHQHAQGRRLGEKLLMDALRRVHNAANLVGCTGVIVDAKNQRAEDFYAKYDFVTVMADRDPRRMFLPIQTIRAVFC